jgi:hypothetical protein
MYRNNFSTAGGYTDSYSRRLEASRRMRIISGIKITENSKLKINYNKRTQIKAGRRIVKKSVGGWYISKTKMIMNMTRTSRPT